MHQNILGLQVTVDDLLTVDIVDCHTYLLNQHGCISLRHLLEFLHQVIQLIIHAGLHQQVDVSLVGEHTVKSHDVGM